ncbi:putative T7SS-secreted protein [Saccharomonospora iraqiensis]|uniref:putative T7SS-secreted protein n=1 Tax=Saccharomonospora iraqiensis TaxID=52698 RepID=UPI0003F77787|nr:hypothetical protein [Saccharomonospora iraqiensis]
MSDADFPNLGFDPAHGDVPSVRDLAEQLDKTGKYAREAFDVLKSVKENKDVWTGNAAQAFAGTLDMLPEYLDKGHESLDKAATALSSWADDLQRHQQKARQLEERAANARRHAENLDSAASTAKANAAAQPDDEQVRASADDAVRAAAAAWDKLNQIRQEARTLQETWQSDADVCEDALKDAVDAAPQKSFAESLGEIFDDVGGWFADHIGSIGDIAGIVSAVAGALAAIPVLTPIAGPIAIGTGAIALAAHGADMVINEKYDDPNAWVGLAGDAVGVLPGVGALAKGFGAAGDVVSGADRLVDVSRASGVTGVMDTAGEAAVRGGKAVGQGFSDAVTAMKHPSEATQWLAERAMGYGALTDPDLTANVAKGFEHGVGVSLQIPSGIGLFDTSDATSDAKDTAGIGSLVHGMGTIR